MDGIRMDSTSNIRGIGGDIPGGWQLLQVDFLLLIGLALCRPSAAQRLCPKAVLTLTLHLKQKINDAVHDRFPHAVTIAEDLYDDDRLTAGGACFDFQWGQGYFKVRDRGMYVGRGTNV